VEWAAQAADQSSTAVDFILNARVLSMPTTLEHLVRETFEKSKPDLGSRYYFTHFECFSPLPPKPTHRLAAVGAQFDRP
jgi:hypothetical protein